MVMNKKVTIILISLIIIVAALLGVKYYNLYRFHLEKDVRLIMDTYVSIYAIGPQQTTAPAIELAFQKMEEIDRKFSSHNPGSPVYEFNQTGKPISDPEIVSVVARALEISKKTNGAFDITIAPIIDMWGFYKDDSPQIPDAHKLSEALQRIGYQYLQIKDGVLTKTRDDLQIDLGGIAKGYNILQASEILRKNGVVSALIDAGGDVNAIGQKGNAPWKVGIRNTRAPGLMGYLAASDVAILGSGDYERFFIRDGKRYHHIINPKTGYPADELSGITIIYEDPMLADAWATTAFVLGPEKGLEAIENIAGMEAIMVTTSGQKILTKGLKNQLTQLP